MNSFSESVADVFLILDAESRILAFAPDHPLPPLTGLGDSLSEIYRGLVSATQLDLLLDQIHDALMIGRATNCIFDLPLGNVTKSFLALFLPMSKGKVMMVIRDVTTYKPFQSMLKRQVDEMTALSRIAKIVFTNPNCQRALRLVIDETVRLVHANHVAVLLSENGEWVTVGVGGVNTVDYEHMLANREIDGYVLRSGKPIHASGEKIPKETAQVNEREPQSLLSVPLRLNNHVIGVIEAIANKPNAFDIKDLRVMNAAANWVAIALAHARPIRQALMSSQRKYEFVLDPV